MKLLLFSYGSTKGGVPKADLVISAEKAPTPSKELRKYTGLDSRFQKEYFRDEAEIFYSNIYNKVVEKIQEKCEEISISVYCLEGKHRSVAIINRLCSDLSFLDIDCEIEEQHPHIDIKKKDRNFKKERREKYNR